MRISLNSCSLRPAAGPWRSLIFITFPLRPLAEAGNYRLTMSANRDGPLGFFDSPGGRLRQGLELRQRFVQLVRKFYELADFCHRASCPLLSLARTVEVDLHFVRHPFLDSYLFFLTDVTFVNQLRRLAIDARTSV